MIEISRRTGPSVGFLFGFGIPSMVKLCASRREGNLRRSLKQQPHKPLQQSRRPLVRNLPQGRLLSGPQQQTRSPVKILTGAMKKRRIKKKRTRHQKPLKARGQSTHSKAT